MYSQLTSAFKGVDMIFSGAEQHQHVCQQGSAIWFIQRHGLPVKCAPRCPNGSAKGSDSHR
jgi:hypothetical protein